MDKITMLIADDEDQFRNFLMDVIKTVLPDKEITYLIAKNGKEAKLIFDERVDKGESLDIVITDFSMPEASGSEVIEHIINKKPLPVIVVSGVSEAAEHDFIHEGAVYFLPKPFELSAVKEVILQAIDLKILPEDISKALDAIEKLKDMDR